eukprot:141164_1
MSSWLTIFSLFCLTILSLNESKDKELIMLTYNVWNYMFSWKARFIRIAQMIEQNAADIVTLQEIYSTQTNIIHSDNQLQYLLSLLPSSYKYHHFSSNIDITTNKYNKDELLEGLAIISKYPISNINKYFFKERSNNPDSGDMNPRMLLKTTIHLSNNYAIDLYSTHLTYDKILQCKHVSELLLQIKQHSLSNNIIKNIFITGDLNVYQDYIFPMQLLQYGTTNHKRCNKNSIDIGVRFIDVFQSMIPNENQILTFSNMPWPGMVSRPDRLYLGNVDTDVLKMKAIDIIGDGNYYKQNFYYSILWNRFWDSLKGIKCKIDCGPNGYCKCGVCVKNPHGIADEMNDCKISCGNCLNDMYSLLKWYFVVIFIHIIAYYGCIHGLYMAPRLKYNSNLSRSIPSIILFGISLIVFLIVIAWYYTQTIQYVVVNMLSEELFPSDHRGLLAAFEYSI